ncbi:MAG: IS110 family transposase [Alphaproteobacteria bacterium]|nr:MAG: IS110 family transposase [Alphaproteobacteria bacterium]
MEVRVVSTPSAGADNEPVHCYVAIELSKSSWIVGFQTPLTNKTSQYQVKACDANALLELIERIRTRVARELRRPIEVMSCYEAGYDGFWLHRVLKAHGIHNHVLDPASLQVNRRARRAKTDRIDADRMVRALIRYLRGEPEACSVVRVPSVEQEDAKRLHRERRRLIAERVQHVNRIKGLCATQGIYHYAPLRKDRLARLDDLRTGDGRALPTRLKAEIARELKRLEVLLEMIATVETERDVILTSAASTHLNAGKIKMLAKLKAIGPEFATTLVGEVFYREFANRRKLGSYVGLGSSPFCSGPVDRDQGISKAGNPTARSMMIELAWTWLRYQPGSALSIWFRERVGNLKGRPRRIAIVAMARKLLVALWRYLQTGLVPTGALLKA